MSVTMDTGRYSRRAPDVDATQWDGTLADAIDVFNFVMKHERQPLFHKHRAKLEVDIMADSVAATLKLPDGIGPDKVLMQRGDWLVRNNNGKFSIMADANFRRQFVRIAD